PGGIILARVGADTDVIPRAAARLRPGTGDDVVDRRGAAVVGAFSDRRMIFAAVGARLRSTSSTNNWSSTHPTRRISRNAGISMTNPTNWCANPSDNSRLQ